MNFTKGNNLRTKSGLNEYTYINMYNSSLFELTPYHQDNVMCGMLEFLFLYLQTCCRSKKRGQLKSITCIFYESAKNIAPGRSWEFWRNGNFYQEDWNNLGSLLTTMIPVWEFPRVIRDQNKSFFNWLVTWHIGLVPCSFIIHR